MIIKKGENVKKNIVYNFTKTLIIIFVSIFVILIIAQCKSKKITGDSFSIDFHHHILPTEYISRLKEIGIEAALSTKFPDWNPEKSLKFMQKNGIDYAFVSISAPGIYFKDINFTKDLARICNEYMAVLKKGYPDKFGSFAVLPLPYVEESIVELKYALDELQLDGVVLLTNYGDKYLGDKEFGKIYDELNQRNTVVFIHPDDPPYDLKTGIPNAIVEATFETTRSITNWIYTGASDKYQNIRFILSHGGGTIPYVAWRLSLIKYGQGYGQEFKKAPGSTLFYDWIIKGGPESGLNILRNMYYDTALTSSPYALKAMQELTGHKKILIGSDFPFAEKLAPINLKDLRKYEGFTKEELSYIEYYNALNIFPNLEDILKK